MTVRPYGLVFAGELRFGLELDVEGGVITRIGPHSGMPDAYVLTPAFVNAHSHLEYRGFQDKLPGMAYFEWILELTARKHDQTLDEVVADCLLAAKENRATGVGLIGEHSDRPGSGAALASVGIKGRIWQEVLTFFDSTPRKEQLAKIETKRKSCESDFGGPVELTPHAPFSVDIETLRELAPGPAWRSMHVAETELETMLFRDGTGGWADVYARRGLDFKPPGQTVLEYVASLGYLRPGVQLVHACDLSVSDVQLVAKSGASVAHCPRSNEYLKCPRAPIRAMLDAGVPVGLGMDSPASGGPIDIFAEMRAARTVAAIRGDTLAGEEIWSMATELGAKSLGFQDWGIKLGSQVPLLRLDVPNAQTLDDLIDAGSPEKVQWIAS